MTASLESVAQDVPQSETDTGSPPLRSLALASSYGSLNGAIAGAIVGLALLLGAGIAPGPFIGFLVGIPPGIVIGVITVAIAAGKSTPTERRATTSPFLVVASACCAAVATSILLLAGFTWALPVMYPLNFAVMLPFSFALRNDVLVRLYGVASGCHSKSFTWNINNGSDELAYFGRRWATACGLGTVGIFVIASASFGWFR